MGHPTGVPADLPELLRDRLGDDLELYPILSYGDTTDVTLLDALFASEPLAEAFAADASMLSSHKCFTKTCFTLLGLA